MKTLKLKDAEIVEIIIRPNEDIPLVIAYNIKDEDGNVVYQKTTQVKKDDLTEQTLSTLDSFADKLLSKLTIAEGL